ncbi:phosphoribosylformylglycinamidine synthase subunit PurQ [Streptomyces sp. NPDC057927]
MTARIGVVTFPGSLDDRDTQRAIKLAGAEPVALWHKDKDLKQVDAVVLPGGFSYGDYLRAGAISRFSPVMETVIEQAKSGMPVLGICNGFQVLTEAHLLPGAVLSRTYSISSDVGGCGRLGIGRAGGGARRKASRIPQFS